MIIASSAVQMPQPAASMRSRWATTKATLLAKRSPRGNPTPLLKNLAGAADSLLKELWANARLPGKCALIAVGGYGRGELFPHSDVDVLLLFEQSPDAAQQQAIEQFVGQLWDIGMEIGHSVRTVDECLAEGAKDITVQTALLESRTIAGNRALAHALQQSVRDALDVPQFLRAKVLEMRQRHTKFQDTPYSLEPNVKESPGGLRDLHVILWIARAAGFGTSFADLATCGLITAAEARRFTRNEHFLKRVRIALHEAAGRREDRLVFDLQTQLAEYFGFKADKKRRASEYLMQPYYWSAKSVLQLTSLVLQNMERAILQTQDQPAQPLTDEFCIREGLLDLTHADVFEKRPAAMLDAFWHMAQHKELKDFSAPLTRAMAHARDRIDNAFRKDPANRARFMDLIKMPEGITHTLRRMNAHSILGRYLPVFRRIVGQMQHDLFHVYTVDQHTLMVVRNVRRFQIADHAHEYPFCSQLIANFDKPWLLTIAALFHDIAKGRGGDHSQLGMEDARKFCREHGIAREDTALVVFLVQHHLSMSKIAQKQDITDPDVVKSFAQLVKTERQLTALYLLTVADIRGTSPKVWNAWKGKLLEDLYRYTRRVLGGEQIDPNAELEARKLEALRILRLYAMPDGAHEALWKTLDVAFFLRHDPQDIAWQTRNLLGRLNHDSPLVRARLAPSGEGLQVMVYSTDRTSLFARICAYFDGAGFNILDAKIHTTKLNRALDTFIVTDAGRAAHYRDIISLIEHNLAAQLSAELASPAQLPPPRKGRMSRQSRLFPIPPAVDWRPDERGQYALLSLTATDRPGLLYAVAKVFSEYKVNVHMAKIMTLGERVEDSFLVDGPILSDPKTQLELEQKLLEVLAPQ
ncbi:MAG: [protein-PII] uridylyltransferase [Burkholderiaceae bacterium]